MAYNMGEGTLKKFDDLKTGLIEGNWTKAACGMAISCWYCEVKCRAVRLITRMLNENIHSDGSMRCLTNDTCLQPPTIITLKDFTCNGCCFGEADGTCFNNTYINQIPKCRNNIYEKICCIRKQYTTVPGQ